MQRKHDTTAERLTDADIRAALAQGVPAGKRHLTLHDGGGLFLRIGAKGAASWFMRYMLKGTARDLGLGPLRGVKLARAREKAAAAREQIKGDGIDPVAEKARAEAQREALEAARRITEARAKTFRQCAEAYIPMHVATLKNAKSRQQWTNTLTTYAYPILGDLPVSLIDTALVMQVLEPIWITKHPTAKKVRERIETILDWAKAHKYCEGENPARLRGLALPKVKRRVRNHPALPFDQLGKFMPDLRARQGIAARALEFTILTAPRTGMAIDARWPEINFEEKVWTVPAERMKADREFRMPLTDRAVAILREMQAVGGEFIFPGVDPNGKPKPGKPLSNMAMLNLLKRMKYMDKAGQRITTHGFRSTFSTWASERSHFPSHVVEMALAHAIEDKVEAAYRRGDLFEKRRELMDAWARACA